MRTAQYTQSQEWGNCPDNMAFWLAELGRDPAWDKWLRPRAYCPGCDRTVDAVQVFKADGVDMGVYGARNGQYVYRSCHIT
jgi:DNA (cytosine-5)-methyltransferase 1